MGFFGKLKRLMGLGEDNSSQDFKTDRRQQRVEQQRQEYQDEGKLKDTIRSILQREYSVYEIREGVEVGELDATQDFGGPIDFALFNGGRLIGAVMILERGKKRTKRIHGVELVCKKLGAGYANFYIGYNNEYFPFSADLAARYLRRQIN